MSILETLLDFSVNDINQISWNTVARTQSVSHPFTILADIKSFSESNPEQFRRYEELHDRILQILYTELTNTDLAYTKKQAKKLCTMFGKTLSSSYPPTVPVDKDAVKVSFEYADQAYTVMVPDRSIFDMSVLGNFAESKFDVRSFENKPKYYLLAKAYAGTNPVAKPVETVVFEEPEIRIVTSGLLGPPNKSYLKDLLSVHYEKWLPESNVIENLLGISAYRSFVDNIKKNHEARTTIYALLDYEKENLVERANKAVESIGKVPSSLVANVNLVREYVKTKGKSYLRNVGTSLQLLVEDYDKYAEIMKLPWVMTKPTESVEYKEAVVVEDDLSLESTVVPNVMNCFTDGWPEMRFSKDVIADILRHRPTDEDSSTVVTAQTVRRRSNFFNITSSDEDEVVVEEQFAGFEDEYVKKLSRLVVVDGPKTQEGFTEFRRRAVAEGHITEFGAPLFPMTFTYVRRNKPSVFGKVTAAQSNKLNIGKVNHTMNLVALDIINGQDNDPQKMVHARAIIMQLRNFLKMLLARMFDYSEISNHMQVIYDKVDWSLYPTPASYAASFSENYRHELLEKAVYVIKVCGNAQGIPVSSITSEDVSVAVLERYETCDKFVHELLRTLDPQLPTLNFDVGSLTSEYERDSALQAMVRDVFAKIDGITLEKFLVETTIENTMSTMAWSKGRSAFKFRSSMMSYYLLSLVCDLFTADRADFDFTNSELFSNNQYAEILRPKIIRPYDFQVRFMNTIFDDMNNYDLNMDSILNFRMVENLSFSKRFPENRRTLSLTMDKLVRYVRDWVTGTVRTRYPTLNRHLLEDQTGPFIAHNWHFGSFPRQTFTDRVPFAKIFMGMPEQAVDNLSRSIPIDMMISILNAMLNQCLDELAAKKRYMMEINRLILYTQRAAILLFCKDPDKLPYFIDEVFDKSKSPSMEFAILAQHPAVSVTNLFQEERRMIKLLSSNKVIPNFEYDIRARLAEMYVQYQLFASFLSHGTRRQEVMQNLQAIMTDTSFHTLHFREEFLEEVYDRFSEPSAPLFCPTMHPFVKLMSTINDQPPEVEFSDEFLAATNFDSAAEVFGSTRALTADEADRYPALIKFLEQMQAIKLKLMVPYVDLEALAVLLDHQVMTDYMIGQHDDAWFSMDFTDSGHVFVTSPVQNSRVTKILAMNYETLNDPAKQEHSQTVYTPARPKNIYVLNAMTNTGKTTLSIMLAKLIYQLKLNFSIVFVTDVDEIENEVITMMKNVGLNFQFANPSRFKSDNKNRNKHARREVRFVEEDESRQTTNAEFRDCRFFLATSIEARDFMAQQVGRRFIPFIDEPTAKTGTIYLQQMMQLLKNPKASADLDRIYSLVGANETEVFSQVRKKMLHYINTCFACTAIIRNHQGLCVLSGSTVPDRTVLTGLNHGCVVKDFPLSRINMSVDVTSFSGRNMTPMKALPPDSQESLRKLNDCPLSKRLLSINRFKDFSKDAQAMYSRMVSFDQFTGQEILNFYMFTLYHDLKARYVAISNGEYLPDRYIDDIAQAIRDQRTTSESIVQNVATIIPGLDAIRDNLLDRMPIVTSPVPRQSPRPTLDQWDNPISYATKTIIFTDDPERYALNQCFPNFTYEQAIDTVLSYVASHTGTTRGFVDTTELERAAERLDAKQRGRNNDHRRNNDEESATKMMSNGRLESEINAALAENEAAMRYNQNIMFDESDTTSDVQKYLMAKGIRLVDDNLHIDKRYLDKYLLNTASIVISDASGAYGLNIDRLENVVVSDKFAVCNSTSTILQALSRVGREKHKVANARMSEFCLFKCSLFALSNSMFTARLGDVPTGAKSLADVYNAAFYHNFNDIDYALFMNMVYATIKAVEHAFRMNDSDSPFVGATNYNNVENFADDYGSINTLVFEDVPSRFNKEITKVLKSVVIPSLVNTQETRIMEMYMQT